MQPREEPVTLGLLNKQFIIEADPGFHTLQDENFKDPSDIGTALLFEVPLAQPGSPIPHPIICQPLLLTLVALSEQFYLPGPYVAKYLPAL